MTNPEVLGSCLNIAGFALVGRPTQEQLVQILKNVVGLVGMDAAGMEPAIWVYPLLSGQGGIGETIVQPLVESFIISDSWPEMDKVYIVLASCKLFNLVAVAKYLETQIGPLLSQGYFTLR